ncbi:MAG: glycosyltransferase [Chitinophagaceae bacterium]
MKLSICCITYNHALFIEECVQGFLLQQVNFEMEMIISDDCSKDDTVKIIEQMQHKYPNKIKLLKSVSNIGMMPNFIKALNYCKGDYIALCEGDDYWTDTNKLQHQVNFLEDNPDYVISFHRVYQLKDGKGLKLSELNKSEHEETYTIEDLAKENFIHTPSVVFRNKQFKNFPDWFKECPIGDYPLHMLNAEYGKIKYFPQPMAVYRIHQGGSWSSKKEIYIYEKIAEYLEIMNRHDFDKKIKSILKNRLLGTYQGLLSHKKEKKYLFKIAKINPVLAVKIFIKSLL